MEHPPRERRRSLLGAVGSVLLTISAAAGMVAVIAVVVGACWGIRPVVVISGSMDPTLPVGSMVFIRTVPAAGVHPGDIVTVRRQDGGTGLITHRVVAAATSRGVTTLRLRGDANAVEDPAPYRTTTVGRFLFDVPGVGGAALFARTPLGLIAIALYVAALLVVLVVGRDKSSIPE